MNSFRSIISVLTTLCLQTAFLQPAFAASAPASSNSNSNSSSGSNEESKRHELLVQIYDVLRPARKHETLSEVYYRAIPMMDEAFGQKLVTELEGKGGLPTPKVTMKKEQIFVHLSETQKLKIEIGGTEEKPTFILNDEVFSRDDKTTLKEDIERATKIVKRVVEAQKKSSLWKLILPEANADLFGLSTSEMLGIGVGVAVLGIGAYMWKKNSDDRALQARCGSGQCVPSCCIANGGCYQNPTNYCQEANAGGWSFGLGSSCATIPSCSNAAAVKSFGVVAQPTPTAVLSNTGTIVVGSTTTSRATVVKKTAPAAYSVRKPSVAAPTDANGQH